MKTAEEQAAWKDLLRIPSVGPALAADLLSLGIRCVEDLRLRDPQALYDALCEKTWRHHDRCVLYSFRAAVYFASTANPEPAKLQWWNWKDDPAIAVKARKAAAARGMKPAGA